MSLIHELLPTSRKAGWVLACVLIVALGLRLCGLFWGVPDGEFFFPLHPDEWINIKAPRDMVLTGDLNPHFFNYGSLHSYLTWLVFLVSKALGLSMSSSSLFVVARLPVIGLGCFSVWLLLPIGRRIGGEKLGLAAAAALAVSPGHVLHSGFYTVDIPSIFFATLALWWALILLETGSLRWLAASSFAVGLAAATKYPMGMAILCPLVALAILSRRRKAEGVPDSPRGVPDVPRPADESGSQAPLVTKTFAGAWFLRGLALAGMVSLLAFLIGVPYAVLDFGEFWADMSYELFEHAMDGHRSLFAATGNGLVHLASVNLLYSLGPTVLLLGTLGFFGLVHKHREKGLVLLGFVLPYVLLLALAKLRFMRYTLALSPFFSLGVAWLMTEALARIHASADERVTRGPSPGLRLGALALLLVAFAWPLLLSSLQARSLMRTDPRIAAARWAKENLPAGARVGMMDYPNWYSAVLSPFNRGNPASFYKSKKRHDWEFSPLVYWDADLLHKQDPEWFVMSEFLWSHQLELGTPAAKRVLSRLDQDFDLAASFENFPTAERWLFGSDRAPHDWLYPFPAQRIWQRKQPSLAPPR